MSGLKAELQGTLKALETWILEQNTKKNHGMKLQPKPAKGGAPSAASEAHGPKPARAVGAPAPAPADERPSALEEAQARLQAATDEKLVARVGELERQLLEAQVSSLT